MDPQKTPQTPVNPDDDTSVMPPSQPSKPVQNTPDMSGLETEKPTIPEEPSEAPGAVMTPEDLTQQPSSDTQPMPLNASSDTTTIASEDAPSDEFSSAVTPPATPNSSPVAPTVPVTDATSPTPAFGSDNPAIVPPIAPAISPKPKRKKWLIALIILAVAIVLGAASAAAYVGYIMPNQPKYVLARALGNTVTASKVHSASFDGSFKVKDADSGQTFGGVFDGKASDKAFDAKLTLDAGVTKIGVNILTADNKDLYLKVSGLDGVPELLGQMQGDMTQYAPLIKSVNNQWITINESLIKSTGVGDIAKDQYGLSDADAKKVETAYRKHLFWQVTKTYDDQDIHGTPSYHYQAKINETELESFLKEVKAQKIKNLAITDQQIADIKKANLGKYPMDVWIAKDSRTINKIAFDIEEDSSAAHFEVSMFNLNKSVTVEAPSNAKTLLQVLSESEAGKGISALLNGMTDGQLESQAQVN